MTVLYVHRIIVVIFILCENHDAPVKVHKMYKCRYVPHRNQCVPLDFEVMTEFWDSTALNA